MSLPPYLIFKGKRTDDDLKKSASPGTVIRMSDTGWSNGQLFMNYLRTHFLKYVTPPKDKKVQLLYDGHKSHLGTKVINWANEHNIILFVLPPHTYHITQPLDRGCLGPVKRAFYDICKSYMSDNIGMLTNRYNMT